MMHHLSTLQNSLEFFNASQSSSLLNNPFQLATLSQSQPSLALQAPFDLDLAQLGKAFYSKFQEDSALNWNYPLLKQFLSINQSMGQNINQSIKSEY